jgi:hypothetical protein
VTSCAPHLGLEALKGSILLTLLLLLLMMMMMTPLLLAVVTGSCNAAVHLSISNC